MTESRAPAQYCPYCGETNLWPHEESHGAWSCRDCRRVFAVRFLGLAASGAESALPGTVSGGTSSDVGTPDRANHNNGHSDRGDHIRADSVRLLP